MTPLGTVISISFCPTKGVPQGGASSPPLWILRISYISLKARKITRHMYRNNDEAWDLAIQIFADNSSVTIAHADPKKRVRMAWTLREIIQKIGIEHDLERSLPKCFNFIVEAGRLLSALRRKQYSRPNA